ncbi:MAG: hypothetical protein HY225_00600 [Candidatus Vogelbacteria bacterium]|nr:hypothetical protein [Candidatus Vogelbacteria bacterium]
MEINREVLKSSVRTRRRKIFHLFSYIVLCVAFVFALTSFLFKLDKFQIKYIYITGNKNVGSDQVFESIKEDLSGQYYGLYAKNSIFIYPKKVVTENIKKQFLWVRDVSIQTLPGIMLVSIKEREPKYLWCSESSQISLENVCYYLDDGGYTFAVAPGFSGNIYLRFYGGNKRGGYMGRNLMSPGLLHHVIDVRNRVIHLIEVSKDDLGQSGGIYVYNNGDYDLLFNKASSTRKISFNLFENPTTNPNDVSVIENKLKSTLESRFFQSEYSSTNGGLEYIDLRFGKKVFYKFYRGKANENL